MIALLVSMLVPVVEAKEVYSGVVRLHILAESNSEEDQALKLKVRDAVLSAFGEEIESLGSVSEVEEYINGNLGAFEECAEKTLLENGCEKEVNLSLCREYYPTREYEGVRLPAGEYLSLRIVIGEGEGRNWWCVMYPPLCTSSAKADEELSEAGFTPNQIRFLTDDESPKYVIKFKIVETVSGVFKKVKGFFS